MSRPRALSADALAFARKRAARGDSHETIRHALASEHGLDVGARTIGRALARERAATASTPARTTPRPSTKSKPVTAAAGATDERADLISLRRDLWARLPEASARDAAQISREVRQINERLATLDAAAQQARGGAFDPESAERVRKRLERMRDQLRERQAERNAALAAALDGLPADVAARVRAAVGAPPSVAEQVAGGLRDVG